MCEHKVGIFYKKSSSCSTSKGDITPPQTECITKKVVKRDVNNDSSSVSNLRKKKCHLIPEGLWKLFPRQQKAFDFSRSCHQSCAVFAVESEDLGTTGQRRYLVTTYYEFGQRYLTMKGARHFYEVVMEDAACRLYFDIEYKTEYNPQTDGCVILECFIQLHCDRSNILDLDSTTPSKFSRHLIFHLPQAVFKSNIHAGAFVHHCCDQLRGFVTTLDSGRDLQEAYSQYFPAPVRKRRQDSPPLCPTGVELKSLFVLNEQGGRILFCDEGVYTRNRNFRLYLSSKLGKGVPLLVAKESCFKSSYREDTVHRRRSRRFNTLMDSLVCNVSFESCSRVLEFNSDKQRHKQRVKSAGTSSCEDAAAGCGGSPFPLVDCFITSTLTRGGVQGSIRRWTYFSQGKQVIYDIQHNRWCENIGRAHKSNNVMVVADLVRGVFYQKCHDPDCKASNFRGNEKPLPPDCNPVLRGPDVAESAELSALLGDITDIEVCEMETEALGTSSLIGRSQSHDSIDELMLEAIASFEGQGSASSSTHSETNFYNISIEEMNSFFDDIDDI